MAAHAHAHHESDGDTPIPFDPKKSRFTLPFVTIVAILLGGFYAGQYVNKLITKVDDTAKVAAKHTEQLATIDTKIDQFIMSQNERTKWQSSSLRAIARKVGADTYPPPNSQDENSPR